MPPISPRRRDLLRALGYAGRQREPLKRFLEDGRLALDNNRSEHALRAIAVGRKAWLFAGKRFGLTEKSFIDKGVGFYMLLARRGA